MRETGTKGVARGGCFFQCGFGLAVLFGLMLATPFNSVGGGVVSTATESALNSALSGGGTVTFAVDGTITLTSEKNIAADTVLDATGHTVTISGGNSVRMFSVADSTSLTLVHLTLANGRTSTNGGAIYNRGDLIAFDCVFTNNAAIGANGVSGTNGADATGTAQAGNGSAGTDGGSILGGAIYNFGTLALTECVFQNNSATGGNGGNGGNGGSAPWNAGDGATGGKGGMARGGAIYSTNSIGITNCTFAANNATGGNSGNGGSGGDGYYFGSNAHAGDPGEGSGAGLYTSRTSGAINSTFYENAAGGGNAGANGTTQLGSQGNSGRNGGSSYGGGVCNVGTNFAINCTFYANTVLGGNGGTGSGAGTWGGGDGGNGGAGSGGGLYSSSTVGVTNCTFSSSVATGGGGGAGGPSPNPGSAGSSGASNGGNVARSAGTFTLKNSILAYATSGGNGNGSITDAGQNISSDTSVTLNGTGSHSNTDPQVSSLADNGGLTKTCALSSTSPAIDAANSTAAPKQDQRGLYRTYGADIGGYEFNAATVPYIFINIQATDTYAAEAGTNTASFAIMRVGKNTEIVSIGLDISGTAGSGTDYVALPTNVVLAAGVMQTNLTVTPLVAAPVEPAETVVVGLKTGTNYLLGLYTNAVVTIAGDTALARASYPMGERYLRGTGTNLDFYTILVPLEGLKGTQHTNLETGSWLSTLYQYNGALGGSQTQTNNRIACNTPVASFGNGWGTPLYVGQSYSIGVHFAITPYDPISVLVYYRSNGAYAGTIDINLPDSSDWAGFATNGFANTVTGYGLKTVLRAAPDSTWGASTVGYALTHVPDSSATNYYYLVIAEGQFNGQEAWLSDAAQARYGYLYDLVFDTRPTWRSVFLDQPQFMGQPLPSDLLNKTPLELLNYAAPVTNTVSLSPSACTNLDQSPELRRHPTLDQFVADLNNDPVALANYVQNEIELTDPIAYRDDGQVETESVNLGGVNRGALGVYLEGQGSPMEQCALLVYLLRQAGYPATYVFPPDGGLKMLDTRLSQLLRMRFKGAQDEQGRLYTTNQLIAVNYPWVAAYVNGQWVHLFPWLKDTQVTEGLDLYDYLPDSYKQLQLWVKDYVFGRTNIMAFAALDDDTPATIFPAYLKNCLLTNAPGISLDDLGMRYINRRHVYSSWSDFPRPTWVTNTSTAIESLTASTITNVSPRLTNVFDTVYVEIFSLLNPQKTIKTAEMRMADLHNRKFYLTHTNLSAGQCQAILTLAPFSSAATGPGSFATNDVALTNKQVATVTFDGTDDELRLRIRHRRQKGLTWQTAVNAYAGFMQISSAREVLQERKLRKGDVAGICLDTGRVTPAMLRVHAQEIWNMEQQLNTNAAAASSVSADVYQGSLVYLLGMSYYERTARFDELNQRLNKVRTLSSFAMGLAKLSPRRSYDGTLADGDIDPVWPNVDMFFREVTIAANGTVRPDSGWDYWIGRQNYLALHIADISAQEHAVLNKFFGQSNSVSAVKILQLAQAKTATGGSNLVELTYYNYGAAGNITYSGKALKNHDASMWAEVTNYFAQAGNGLFTIAWMPPGNQTTPSGSYSGMAALVLNPEYQAALIGNNQYGAYAEQLAAQAVSAGNTPQIALRMDSANNVSCTFATPQANQNLPGQEVTPWFSAPETANLFNNNAFTANPNQILQGQMNGLVLNGLAGTFAGTFDDTVDLGLIQTKTDNRKTFGQTIADPVNALTGEFYIDEVDLSLPGPMPLQVRRNYGSQNLANNQLGYGWKLNYMPFLTVAAASNVLYAAEADGSVLAFSSIGTDLWAPTVGLNPTLNNDSADGIGSVANRLNARLSKVFTNSANVYYLTNGDGSLRVFQEMSFPLTNSAGFDRLRPYLTAWHDPRGNFYRFEYGNNSGQADYGQVRRITSSSGNAVRFEYDVYGRVVNTYSLDGRRLQYAYDEHGDLKTVTRPDTSEINYEYQLLGWATNGVTNVYSTHLVLRELKPDGRVLQNDYDDQRRVTNQWSTVGPDLRLVRNATFRYTNNFSLTNLTGTLTGTTTILDYTNNPLTYYYTNGLIRRIHDPLGGEITQTWYEATDTNAPAYPRSLNTVTDKRGLVTTYLYDNRGNATNTTVRGDLRGDGDTTATATTIAVFNANNLVEKMVDPSGTTNLFFYTNTWLLARREIWPANASPAQAITNLYGYATVTNAADGTVSFGLRVREIRAAYSPDATTNEWAYNSRGFPTNQIHYTSTGDPAVSVTNVYNSRGALVQLTDAAGRSTRLGYDPRGNLQSREVYDVGQSVPMSWDYSYYNENGELTWSDGPRFDPEDYVWRDYDGAGRKTQEIHWRSQGREDGTGVEAVAGTGLYAAAFAEYDPFNNLTKATDPRGNYSLKKYDALGQLIREEFYDAGGVLLATNGLAYNLAGDVTNAFNALGASAAKQYTGAGKPKFQRNADGSTNAWRYYVDGRAYREFQVNGAYWQTTYDDAKRITTRVFYSSAGVPLATNVAELDRRGNVVRTVDAAGFGRTNSFDGLDRLKWAVGPKITFDPPPGTMLPPDYHPPPPVQQASTNFYDAAGVVTTNVNAIGDKRITWTDALGRETRTEIRSAANVLVRESSVAYASNHQSTTVTNGSGGNALISTAYTDNDGKTVLSIAFPYANVREFTRRTYDLAGNPESSARYVATNSATTPPFSQELYAYDGLNRLIIKADRDVALTYFNYDAAGNLTNREMPGGLKWRAEYNPAGQLLKSFNLAADNTGTRTNTYTYNSANTPFAGLQQTHTDGRGVVCTSSYDDFLRPLTNSYSGSLAEHNLTTVWSYDVRGFVTDITESFASSSTGPTTAVTRTYDGNGLLTGEDVRINSALQSGASHGWNSAGRRTTLNFANMKYGFGWQADGQMASVSAGSMSGSYSYGTGGLLTSRYANSLSVNVTSRDGAGRVLAQTSSINGTTRLSETLAWTGDGLLSAHTVARSDFTDTRSYEYADDSRRLATERVSLDAAKRWTNVFSYDQGVGGLAGVLTKVAEPQAGGAAWTASLDAFDRIERETNNVIRRVAYGRMNASLPWATPSVLLDGRSEPLNLLTTGETNWPTQWRTVMELRPGTHTLQAVAAHSSGRFTTNTSVTFTNTAVDTTTLSHFAEGQLSYRVWRNQAGQTNRVQTFTWDARSRLVAMTEWDAGTNGYNWTAVYDALGRRLQTTTVIVTNGVALSAQPKTINSIFDPAVEFLELGVKIGGKTTWKIYGPDLSGNYGGVNGLGGLDGLVDDFGVFRAIVADARGNVHGKYESGTTNVLWNDSRPTGYGAVPEYRPVAMADNGDVALASAWRGRWADLSGLYWLGARYYDPVSGSFLSCDPYGHDADASLYGFCGGDPINYFDADGRCLENATGIGADINRAKGFAQEVREQASGLAQAVQNPGQVFRNLYNAVSNPGQTLNAMFDRTATDAQNYWSSSLGFSDSSIHQNMEGRGMASALLFLATEGIGEGVEFGGQGSKLLTQTERVLPKVESTLVRGETIAAKGVESINTAAIRFSQSSVSDVEEIAASMRANGWQGAPIDVVRMGDGALTTFDNTRVLAANRAGIDVQAIVREAGEEFPAGRWTPKSGVKPTTWEQAVQARIQQQNRLFRQTYPNGSPITGSAQ